MDSEMHRDNILRKDYTEIGVAVAKNEKGEPYWVQVFGKP
ncbi:CAP domain-containing protein [Gemmata massiliana]